MNLQPPSLNIPLERKERWGLVLVGACCAAVALTTFVNASFAKVFAASCIVGLPVLWLFFFPPHRVAAYINRGGMVRFAVYFVLFAYLSLAKKFLVPLLVVLIEHIQA